MNEKLLVVAIPQIRSKIKTSTHGAQISDKTAHYPYFARICNLESHGDLDHNKNLINCFLYHCRAILRCH